MNMVEVKNLSVHFETKAGIGKKQIVKAVDRVNFAIGEREILSLVGESGSGKTTTGKALLGLIPPTSGEVFFEEKPLNLKNKAAMRKFRKNAQMIFQDPYQSLNPT
jgi:ABC-type oligopeptide transport system ATPase subunit